MTEYLEHKRIPSGILDAKVILNLKLKGREGDSPESAKELVSNFSAGKLI